MTDTIERWLRVRYDVSSAFLDACEAIRLADEHPDAVIKIKCFNREEADEIESIILKKRPDLRGRFFTTWLKFE